MDKSEEAAVASAHARVVALQQHTDRLSNELHRVTAQLSARTASSVALTVAHSETADRLASHCVTSVDELRDSAEAFVKDVANVRASLEEITAIAMVTQQVKAELVRLEAASGRVTASSPFVKS